MIDRTFLWCECFIRGSSTEKQIKAILENERLFLNLSVSLSLGALNVTSKLKPRANGRNIVGLTTPMISHVVSVSTVLLTLLGPRTRTTHDL